MLRTCHTCSTVIRSHVTVIDHADYCSPRCAPDRVALRARKAAAKAARQRR